jgi:uncharacterized protein YcbK (DUF882 family)
MGDLTKNFSLHEFACGKDAVPQKYEANVRRLAKELQKIRDVLNTPVRIKSGWRTPEVNKACGGVSRSFHLTAKAADIVADGVPVGALHRILSGMMRRGEIQNGGLGLYPGRFIHYDIRSKPARWTKDGAQ